MSQLWKEEKLGDILEVLTDYHANGSYKKLKENVEMLDVPSYALMIRTTDFERNDFSENVKYISKEAYEFLTKSKVYHEDIIMNKIANAGRVYFVPNLNRPISLGMNLFLLRVNRNIAVPRYVYYYIENHMNNILNVMHLEQQRPL